MIRLAEFVENGCLELAKLSVRLIHRGTVTRYGKSPGTPVVTGQHRSGGRTSYGSPPTFVPEDNAPAYPIFGEHEVDASLSGSVLGDDFFWRSLAPVPALLEDGLSQQAPSGFLQHSIDAAKSEVESTRWDG